MFAKPFRVKSSSQMKGSDKKKLKAQILKKFNGLTDEILNGLIPNKEEVIVSKIYTFSGESLLLYIHQKEPLFFEFEKDKIILPTVYAMWKHPDLLSAFTTWPNVVSKLLNGADLMIPGILVDHDKGIKAYLDGKLNKGDPLSINLSSNKASVAIGTSYHSSEDMYMAGRRGKGVKILHCVGDHLWISGTRRELPDMGPPEGLDFLKNTEENAYESDQEEEEEKETQDDVDKNDDSSPTNEDNQSEDINEISEEVQELNIEEPEEDTRTPQEINDELLINSFLQAWKTTAKKAELPMLTSNFFRLHMVPQCPNGKTIDVKKSSYKKLSKFLAAMQKQGIIVVKELQKGVESITKVDLEHEKIQSYRVVKVEKPECDEPKEDVLPCDRKYEPPKIIELYMVSAVTLPFFKTLNLKKGDGLTALQIRDLIKNYVLENVLQNNDSKSQVNLDPVMAGVVLGKGENHITSLSWEEINERFKAKMSPGYSLQFGEDGMTREFKGKIEPIQITTATRSGNKKVTLLYNLELYGIDHEQFAHKCQLGVAASTSVNNAANRKPGAKEVLIQGNQVRFVNKLLLEEYKIPRKYVVGGEDSKKKKKK